MESSRHLAAGAALATLASLTLCACTRAPATRTPIASTPLQEPSEGLARSAVLADRLYLQANQARRDAGLTDLERTQTLDRLAGQHSRTMAASDRGPSHDGFDQRSRQVREDLGNRSFAENVASSRSTQDPIAAVLAGWLDSDGHRRNLLGSYRRTGVGVAISQSGQVFVTQLYTD